MHIKAGTLDDLLVRVFRKALKSKVRTRSSKGPARELLAVILTLENPRARFSRTERRGALFSCLGETLWYLSGSKRLDVIEYYIPRYREYSELSRRAKTAPGAYGPRIFGGNGRTQYSTVIEHLRNRKDTRQAVIQIFDAKDLGGKDVPCTCTLQFMARGGKLHMLTQMRSNDVYLGLPHDVFAFTLLQEIVARTLSHEVGLYHHAVGSLHLYESNEGQAREFLEEGWQEKMAMPPMPVGDPWPSIRWLLGVETAIRIGELHSLNADGIHPYWIDLARLLRIHALLKSANKREIIREKNGMSSQVYDAYIRSRARAVEIDVEDPQLSFSGMHID
jgi:thymidylate synthase